MSGAISGSLSFREPACRWRSCGLRPTEAIYMSIRFLIRSGAKRRVSNHGPQTLLLVHCSSRAPTLESDAHTLEGHSDGYGRTGRRLWPMLQEGPRKSAADWRNQTADLG